MKSDCPDWNETFKFDEEEELSQNTVESFDPVKKRECNYEIDDFSSGTRVLFFASDLR